MSEVLLKVKKLHPDATLPQYQTAGAACFDLHALVTNERVGSHAMVLHILPGKAAIIRTGLAFELQEGWALMGYSRSGHGFKHGIRLGNGTAILDQDYRGELMLALHNDSSEPFIVKTGDRIAQAMVVRAPRAYITEVDELSDTARGTGGLGSTGN